MSIASLKDMIKPYIKLFFQLYTSLYNFICGNHPHLRPWHFQWHALKDLNRDLKAVLPTLTGNVLDMGCGMGPYRSLLKSAGGYVGADIEEGPGVDVVIVPEAPLPFEDDYFDAIISTQVFEHVADLDFAISEIRRVLKPGGKLVASVPFVYQVHGAPHDYRRLSEYGLEQLLAGFSIEKMHRHGAIGSTLAIVLLGWINTQLGVNVVAWVVKVALLPFWIPFCLLVNICALLLDFVDTTKSVYHNLSVVARLS